MAPTDRAALEAAIADDPDSREAVAVYGDWLLEQGDPEGELVAVQLALEERPGDLPLRAREQTLITERTAALARMYFVAMGAIREPIWRRGLLSGITVHGDAYSNETAMACEELLADPCSRFLRDLTVRSVTVMHGDPTPGDGDLVAAIAKHGVPRTLRRLAFLPLDFQISWTRLTDLSPAYPQLERLEELVIEAGDLALGTIDLPALRSLELVTGGLRAHVIASIAAGGLRALERLIVYFGREAYGGTCTFADAERLLVDGALAPTVTELGLANCEFANELVEPLALAPLLGRLRRLDLSQGTLTDDGATALLAHADAFRHLEALDLSDNYLSLGMLGILRAAGLPISNGSQREPDEGLRYAAIGE
jgi:uncharacterized protein (TIGR02996 family)